MLGHQIGLHLSLSKPDAISKTNDIKENSFCFLTLSQNEQNVSSCVGFLALV